jgi:hypothetical protein
MRRCAAERHKPSDTGRHNANWGDGDSDLNEMDDSVSRCVNSAHVRDIDGLN